MRGLWRAENGLIRSVGSQHILQRCRILGTGLEGTGDWSWVLRRVKSAKGVGEGVGEGVGVGQARSEGQGKNTKDTREDLRPGDAGGILSVLHVLPPPLLHVLPSPLAQAGSPG